MKRRRTKTAQRAYEKRKEIAAKNVYTVTLAPEWRKVPYVVEPLQEGDEYIGERVVKRMTGSKSKWIGLEYCG